MVDYKKYNITLYNKIAKQENNMFFCFALGKIVVGVLQTYSSIIYGEK